MAYPSNLQVIHNPTVVMRIKSRAHMASSLIITRDSKTRNHHQEGKDTVGVLRSCWAVEIILGIWNRFHQQTPNLKHFFRKVLMEYEFRGFVLWRMWKLSTLSFDTYNVLLVKLLFSCKWVHDLNVEKFDSLLYTWD